MKRSAMPRSARPLARRTRLRARSVKRSDPDRLAEEARVRSLVFARDGGCLLRDHTDEWGPCFGKLCTFHHLKKAGQGGDYTEHNGVCLCSFHNDEQEVHQPKSLAWGLTVNRSITHSEAARRRGEWAPTPEGARA